MGMGGNVSGRLRRRSATGQNQIWVVGRPVSLHCREWIVAGQCVGRKDSLEGITVEQGRVEGLG